MNEKTNNWFETTKQQIEDQSLNKIKAKDVRFYNLGSFITIAQRIDQFSHTCSDCEKFKDQISEMAQNLEVYINTSMAKRKEFEKKRDIFTEHLKKKHHLVKKNLYAPTYGFVGLLLGALAGYLLALILSFFTTDLPHDFMRISVLIGWAIGLGLGRWRGSKKDKTIVKAQLYF
jgi:glutaredoxin-related protein